MISAFKNFLKLPNPDKWLIVRITLIVPLVELSIKTLKFKRSLSILRYFLNKDLQTPESARQIIGRFTYFLYLYQRKLPWLGKCLARSLTLWFLLNREGIETDLKFGMKKENGKLLAHAWIEYDGEAILTEAEPDGNYVAFSESISTEYLKL